MKRLPLGAALLLTPLAAFAAPDTSAEGEASRSVAGPRVTYHWHQHQPIYWNDQRRAGAPDRYEYVAESIQQKNAGSPFPRNDLDEIFGKPDRVDAYQFGMKDSIGRMSTHPNAGVSISYSGALMENVQSLAQAGQLGYQANWRNGITDPHGWRTTANKPKLDLLNFTFHHSLTGLHDPRTTRMEIELFREKVRLEMGEQYLSRGFFPTELTFSTRLIPILADLGIEWSYVSGEKIARACPDFPVVLGGGGVMCAPPNPADQLNPDGVNFIRAQINRGCSPVNANPLSYQPHFAQHVDPETGEVTRLIVVPVDQAQGWRDGEGCIDGDFIDPLAPLNDPARPSLVVLCHDGDNAFGGGFTYYNNCVPDLANNVRSRGGEMTTIEQYLAQFPVPEESVVHVEDGGWVNADGDFGSPTFINWNYPLLSATGQVDVVNGWHEKPRDMAIFTATLNRIVTAEQIHGHAYNLQKILYPDASTHPIDRAWHYHLGSLDSGNVYFGPALDLEVKATLGANEAAQHVDPLLADLSNDLTPPTIWLPQRFPYNPGGLNYGVEFGYVPTYDDGDFHVWTFIHDVSGPVTATLKYRVDHDGANPLSTIDNELYAEGPHADAWVSLPMNGRAFPKGLPAGFSNPDVDFFELPTHIADHFSVEVTGLRDVLIDYYVESEDALGNLSRSPIQHVYVGDGSGGGGNGGGPAVTLAPEVPVRGLPVTVEYDANGRVLSTAQQVFMRWGTDGWTTVNSPDVPMQDPDGDKVWTATLTVPLAATELDLVFNNGAGQWDNNGGADWRYATDPFTGGPLMEVSRASIAFSATQGSAPAPSSFTVRNIGSGELLYAARVAGASRSPGEIARQLNALDPAEVASDGNDDGLVDAADAVFSSDPSNAAPAWISLGPVDGASTGEADSVSVQVDASGLAPGSYGASVLVTSPNAVNTRQEISVSLQVLDDFVPTETTVQPLPPIAGSTARVWYDASTGPFPAATTVVLHWGINGGASGGGGWQGVTDTTMTAGPGAFWFADITLPANATSLNFVTNNGAGTWDNNGGANWNFAVQPAR